MKPNAFNTRGQADVNLHRPYHVAVLSVWLQTEEQRGVVPNSMRCDAKRGQVLAAISRRAVVRVWRCDPPPLILHDDRSSCPLGGGAPSATIMVAVVRVACVRRACGRVPPYAGQVVASHGILFTRWRSDDDTRHTRPVSSVVSSPTTRLLIRFALARAPCWHVVSWHRARSDILKALYIKIRKTETFSTGFGRYVS